MSPPDTKNWARQIVKSSFDEILVGKFQIPSQEEIKTQIRDELHLSFNEYQVRKRIQALHPGWSEIEISDEIEMKKRHYERENHNRLTWIAQNTVKDIEKLIRSLEQAIADWKILNL